MTRERLQRLLRLAILRGDRAAELIIRGHLSGWSNAGAVSPQAWPGAAGYGSHHITESEQRLMDGNR